MQEEKNRSPLTEDRKIVKTSSQLHCFRPKETLYMIRHKIQYIFHDTVPLSVKIEHLGFLKVFKTSVRNLRERKTAKRMTKEKIL